MAKTHEIKPARKLPNCCRPWSYSEQNHVKKAEYGHNNWYSSSIWTYTWNDELKSVKVKIESTILYKYENNIWFAAVLLSRAAIQDNRNMVQKLCIIHQYRHSNTAATQSLKFHIQFQVIIKIGIIEEMAENWGQMWCDQAKWVWIRK